MSAPNSPTKTTKSPKKPVTRYGVVANTQPAFAKEERFAWQKPQFSSDSVYNIALDGAKKNIVFGTSLRKDESVAEAAKSSTGPGSYEFMKCYDHHSEYARRDGNKFALAPRQSMAMKTPSPGAVYNLGTAYYRGPEKKQGLGFAVSQRKSLYPGCASADADLFMPPAERGVSITITGKPKEPSQGGATPGAVYDVHNKVDFRTGPSYSFGKGKGDRFKTQGFLPEGENCW